MRLAEDLLKQAFLLVRKEPKHRSQASLPSSVSTAYYALFHPLCSRGLRKLEPFRHTEIPRPRF